MMVHRLCSENDGFTLIELLISISIFCIIIAAIFSFFITQRKYFSVQKQISGMIQNARAAMDMISGELMIAGYDPKSAGFPGILLADPSQVQIQADLNGNGTTTGSTNPNELVTYSYDAINRSIDRKTNIGGSDQPLAENIQSFSFEYLDAEGKLTAETTKIRQIRITITIRTSKPDPQYTANSGYRTYTLTSLLTPRNLAYR